MSSAADFVVQPIPDVRDVALGGPPVFFHGPQPGSPALGVPDQPVLVLFMYPKDHDPGTPAQRAALRTAEIAKFEVARRYWQEVSYSSTSWKFDYTQWLPLPANRDYYMWQADDLRYARLRLFEETKRDAAMHNGAVFATHRDNAMATVNLNMDSSPNNVSWTNIKAGGTGVRISGDRAFVTAGAQGLYVFDLVNSPATFVKHVAGGWYADLDLAGNTLAIAALGDGLRLYDVSITALPTLRGSLSFGGAQVTAVRILGSRATRPSRMRSGSSTYRILRHRSKSATSISRRACSTSRVTARCWRLRPTARVSVSSTSRSPRRRSDRRFRGAARPRRLPWRRTSLHRRR